MADLRIFTDPFSKNESRIKRNPRDGRWIPAKDTQSNYREQAGPSKTCHLVKPKSNHVSQVPVISIDLDGRQANISDIENVSPKAWNHALSRTQPKQVSPISPISSDHVYRRGSPVSAIEPIGLSLLKEERNDSGDTVFPIFPTAINKPDLRPKRGLVGFFRSVKLIYHVGPDGEGQQVWKGYRQFRKAKQKEVVSRQERSAALKNKTSRTVPRSDAPGLMAHPAAAPLAVAPPLRPLPAMSLNRFESRNIESSDGKISTSSRDIPIGMDNNVRQFVDTNKPLPRAPRLEPPPKVRREVDGANGHMVGFAAAGIQFPTQWRGAEQHGDNDDSDPATWWKARADKQTAKAHQALKSKISHPVPLAGLSEGRTVNVAPECGGVGGPAAATSIPVRHNGTPPTQIHHMKRKEARQPPPLNLDFLKERTKGKQKAKESAPTAHWRDMLDTIAHPTGRLGRRRSSESSFGCQGVSDGTATAFVQGAGPSTQIQTHRTHVNDETMVPEPLFSNTCGADEGVRDTRFYQPYRDILDEY